MVNEKRKARNMEIMKTILSLIISLSTVLGIFTGIINKSFAKRLKPLEDRIERGEKNSMKHDLGQLRYLVVSFANDLRNGVPKSKFQFDAVFAFIDEYEEMISKLKIKNSLFHEEVTYIRDKYHELEDKK